RKTHVPSISLARELAAVATCPVVSAIVLARTESRARFRTERGIFESMFNSPLRASPRSLRPVRLHGVGTARLAEAEAARKEAHRIPVQGGRRNRSSGTGGRASRR